MESEKPVYPSTQSISYLKDSHLFSEPESEFRTKKPLVLELWPLEGEKIPEGIVALSGQAHGGLAMWWLLDTRTGNGDEYPWELSEADGMCLL